MRTVVIGGAGFIGSHLVDRLIKDGNEVTVIDNLSTGKKENINPKASFSQMDISIKTAPPYLEILLKDVDVVFHLAAKARVQPSIKEPVEFNNVNVTGLLHVLEACINCDVKRFIYSSSSSVYGNTTKLPSSEADGVHPMSPYALQKLIGEEYCRLFSELYGLETASLRYFNVYGERQPTSGAYCLVMGTFAQQRLEGKPMTIRGDGEQRRDFTYVGDVVDANIKCMDYPLELNGDVFNIGNGDNRSVNEIAELIGGDRINVDPVVEPFETLADNTIAKKYLNWKPTTNVEDWIPKWKEKIGL